MTRTLAIGDVHGCLTPLAALAEAVPLRPSDTVVMLGDYSSRGPDSRRVHEWLCDRREVQRAGGGELVTLRGNHEVMLLQSLEDPLAFRSWHSVGGRETLASYGREDTDLREPDWLPDRHQRLVEDGLRPYFETETHVFVHASLPPDVPPEKASNAFLHWEPFNATGRRTSPAKSSSAATPSSGRACRPFATGASASTPAAASAAG